MSLDISKYLRRIQFEGKVTIDANCLKELHRCHVMSVPFEDLDIHFGRTISLNINSLYQKVIDNQRGGFCYELNYLFYSLLHALGFRVRMISSRIYKNDTLGPQFDHMSLVVELGNEWLVDVGYGDLFISPLIIETNQIQHDKFGLYKIEKQNESGFILWQSKEQGMAFEKRYWFDPMARSIRDFDEQCTYKQSSPESHFVKNLICTLPTEKGRNTIFNQKFKKSFQDCIEEEPIQSKQHLLELLKNEFHLNL